MPPMFLRLAATALMIMTVLAGCSSAVEPSSRIALTPLGTLDAQTRNLRRTEAASLSEQIQELTDSIVADGEYPGLLAGLVVDGELVAFGASGFADVEAGIPVSRDTVFRLASITKTVTALTALALRDQSALLLDAPLATIVPELREVGGTDTVTMSLRQLLTHSSGLPRNGSLDITRSDRPITEAEVLTSLNGIKLAYPTGADVLYSNLGFAVAGIALARVAGTTLEELFQTTLLRPLGMKSTSLTQPKVGLATAYRRRGSTFTRTPVWQMGAAGGMGGLFSTLDDMVAWAALQMDAWPPRGAAESGPVRRATVRETHRGLGFHRPDRAMHGGAWGLSAERGTDALMLSHTGATFGYTSIIRILPERGIAVIAFANAGGHGPINRLSFRLLRLAGRRLSDQGLMQRGRARPTSF